MESLQVILKYILSLSLFAISSFTVRAQAEFGRSINSIYSLNSLVVGQSGDESQYTIYHGAPISYMDDFSILEISNNLEGATLYPNPSDGLFKVKIDSEIYLNMHNIAIFKLDGTSVSIDNMKFDQVYNELIFNIDDKGIFFLEIVSDEIRLRRKIIIN